MSEQATSDKSEGAKKPSQLGATDHIFHKIARKPGPQASPPRRLR